MTVYEFKGPLAEAVRVRNREQDTKDIDLPVLGEDDKPVRLATGKRQIRTIRLGSVLDEELAEEGKGIGPEVIVGRKDWEQAKKQGAVRGWLKARRIEAASAV